LRLEPNYALAMLHNQTIAQKHDTVSVTAERLVS